MSKKPQKKMSRYIDATGEFSNRNLSLATWYIRHKIILQNIGLTILIVFCIFTLGISVIGWGGYLFFGYGEDRARLVSLSQLENYTNFHTRYSAVDIKVKDTKVYPSGEDRFAFASLIQNPNERYIAHIKFSYLVGKSKTSIDYVTVLPNQEVPLVVFGYESFTFPSNVRLFIEDITWEYIDPHDTSNVGEYMQEHEQVTLDQFVYTPARGVTDAVTHQIEFAMINDTAYGYWQPLFIVELLNGSQAVGYLPLTLDVFRAGEVKNVDLRSTVDSLQITNIRVIPINNIFDPSFFVAPGE